MDLRRLRKGEWIAGISGAVLIVSLSLPWWSLPGTWAGTPGSLEGAYFERSIGSNSSAVTEWNAWQVFSVADLLFLVLGLFAIAIVVIVARSRTTAPGVAAEALATPLAIAAAIVALVQVLGTPGSLDFSVGPIEASTEYGAWLGLASVLGVLVGVLVGMRDERLSKPGALTDQTGVPVAQGVEIETLPAPPAA